MENALLFLVKAERSGVSGLVTSFIFANNKYLGYQYTE
jgi:hypothetical protein